MKPRISFRKVSPSDNAFLYQLYASTRIDIAICSIPESQKRQLIRMQFAAQTQHYKQFFRSADFLIVMSGRTPVGRLYVHRTSDEIRVIDIALMPEFRGKGIGTQLLADLLDEARIADKPVRLHVEKMDRAIRLYERLGFKIIAEKEMHFFMEYKPTRKVGSWR